MMRKWINLMEDASNYVGYHGTSTEFVEFDDSEVYFATDIEEAKSYCRVGFCIVWECEFTIRNPYRTDDYDYFAEAVHVIHDLKQQGYDAIIYGNDEQFCIFGPDQIVRMERVGNNAEE
jgi:hypothetical protein